MYGTAELHDFIANIAKQEKVKVVNLEIFEGLTKAPDIGRGCACQAIPHKMASCVMRVTCTCRHSIEAPICQKCLRICNGSLA